MVDTTCCRYVQDDESVCDVRNVVSKAVEQLVNNDQCLDIGQQHLITFPENLYSYCAYLKFLYLEGNHLERLPASLFPSLPQLRWLDVRNNLLRELPASMGHHHSLEVLLLQGNQLRELPVELGLVPRLRGLQLSGNPLQTPPADVVRSGVQAVLSYLRQQWALRAQSPPPVKPVEELVYKDTRKDRVSSGRIGPKSCRSAKAQGRHSANVPRTKAKSADLPAIAVRGYRYSRELVAPGTTPSLTHGRESPDSKRVENFHNVNKFRSVHEKLLHLWPSASADLINSDKMELRVQEKYLKEVCVYKLKEMLERQVSVLQRRSNAAVLKLWRKDVKFTNKPRAKKSTAPPYGTDANYSRMLSRAEAYDPASRQRRNVASDVSACRSLDDEMEDLICRLDKPCVTSDLSPVAAQKTLQAEIRKLTELQCRLQALKLRNSHMNTSNAARKQ